MQLTAVLHLLLPPLPDCALGPPRQKQLLEAGEPGLGAHLWPRLSFLSCTLPSLQSPQRHLEADVGRVGKVVEGLGGAEAMWRGLLFP